MFFIIILSAEYFLCQGQFLISKFPPHHLCVFTFRPSCPADLRESPRCSTWRDKVKVCVSTWRRAGSQRFSSWWKTPSSSGGQFCRPPGRQSCKVFQTTSTLRVKALSPGSETDNRSSSLWAVTHHLKREVTQLRCVKCIVLLWKHVGFNKIWILTESV